MIAVSRVSFAAFALAVLSGLPGCSSGGHDAATPGDQTTIIQFVKSFNGSKSNPKNAPQWFASGAVPGAEELRKLAKYNCKVAEKPTVSGDTATIKMKCLDASDKEIGEVEWALVREGGNWKIKSAPVP